MQQKHVEGAKDKFEEEITFINDVTDYNQWMSESKVLGSIDLRVEIFFTIKTNTAFR